MVCPLILSAGLDQFSSTLSLRTGVGCVVCCVASFPCVLFQSAHHQLPASAHVSLHCARALSPSLVQHHTHRRTISCHARLSCIAFRAAHLHVALFVCFLTLVHLSFCCVMSIVAKAVLRNPGKPEVLYHIFPQLYHIPVQFRNTCNK